MSYFILLKIFLIFSNSCASGERKYLLQFEMLASLFLSRMSLPLGHGIKGIYLLFPTLVIILNLQ